VQKADRICASLTKLIGNVILLRDDDNPDKFYPRFQLSATSSFQAFDSSKHSLLCDLHDGYFYRNHDTLWADCARRTLPVLMRSTNMLMCGEDLGFVPACVPPVMHELGVIGLRIQRMPGSDSPKGAP
jgi:4-alpha-glucanotransferase